IRKKYSTYLDKYYWKPYFWSRSYCLIYTVGASIDIIKKYIKEFYFKFNNELIMSYGQQTNILSI
ncbi:transposase, partial [Borreliella americana]|uniref:transposase n=1 Tax=Borreliella americana TaxID=478807 RepID=UPI001E2B183A